MNNYTTPMNRRTHASRRVIAIDSDDSETDGLSDHNGSLTDGHSLLVLSMALVRSMVLVLDLALCLA